MLDITDLGERNDIRAVYTTEQAVVLRFGKYVRTVGPGLQTKLPLGIEKNYNVETAVVKTLTFGYRATDISGTSLSGAFVNTDESMMLTGDLNIVDVEWIVQYRINDPQAYLFSVRDKETTIRDISQSVMNQLVGDLPILAIMTSERTNIEYEAQREMQELFDSYGFGIEIVAVKLQNIMPPEGEVQDAFEDVNKAIQDMNSYINELCAVVSAKNSMGASCEAEKELIKKLSASNEAMYFKIGEIEQLLVEVKGIADVEKSARFFADKIIPVMQEMRAYADDMEVNTAKKYWPFPTYGDILFSV